MLPMSRNPGKHDLAYCYKILLNTPLEQYMEMTLNGLLGFFNNTVEGQWCLVTQSSLSKTGFQRPELGSEISFWLPSFAFFLFNYPLYNMIKRICIILNDLYPLGKKNMLRCPFMKQLVWPYCGHTSAFRKKLPRII